MYTLLLLKFNVGGIFSRNRGGQWKITLQLVPERRFVLVGYPFSAETITMGGKVKQLCTEKQVAICFHQLYPSNQSLL